MGARRRLNALILADTLFKAAKCVRESACGGEKGVRNKDGGGGGWRTSRSQAHGKMTTSAPA